MKHSWLFFLLQWALVGHVISVGPHLQANDQQPIIVVVHDDDDDDDAIERDVPSEDEVAALRDIEEQVALMTFKEAYDASIENGHKGLEDFVLKGNAFQHKDGRPIVKPTTDECTAFLVSYYDQQGVLLDAFNKLEISPTPDALSERKSFMLNFGKKFNRSPDSYLDGGLLHSGAFGKVYKVGGAHSVTAFACKVIPLTEQRQIDIANAEVKCLQLLNGHPFIITIQQEFQKNGNQYILLEFAPLGNLSMLIKGHRERKEWMNESKAFLILGQLLQAVTYCHTHQIIHRDIKPSNILVFDGLIIKLSDFGLAREVGEQEDAITEVRGTLSYASPEIIKGEPYLYATDMWSLGCVLYELAALRPTFTGAPSVIMADIVNEKYETLNEERCSPFLITMTKALLDLNPFFRPSAHACLIAYHKFVAHVGAEYKKYAESQGKRLASENEDQDEEEKGRRIKIRGG